MNKALFCVGACAMIAAHGCAAETTDDDAVDAERVALDVAPIVGGVKTMAYPAAALLNMRAATGASYACTATVIAPRVVLTAGHCVDGMVAWEVMANGSLRTSTKGETYDWKENGATTVNPLHHDLGLVYLTDPIVLPSYPTLATQSAAVGAAAIDVGRIRNAAVTNEIYSAPITLRSGLAVGFPFDYAAEGVIEHGDSGGPVFLGATQTIVAVNSGLGGNTEVLARVDLLADWLRGRIAAQAAAPPLPPPPPSACAITESEPNNVVGSATAFKTTACGKLGTADDLDWFLYAATVGRTSLLLGGDGDAAATFGVFSAGKCVPFVQSARGVVVSVAAGTAQICIGVSSAAHKAQPYGLAAVR